MRSGGEHCHPELAVEDDAEAEEKEEEEDTKSYGHYTATIKSITNNFPQGGPFVTYTNPEVRSLGRSWPMKIALQGTVA